MKRHQLKPPEFVFDAGDSVSVAVLRTTPKPYDYCVAEGLQLVAGSIVRVPLGRQDVYGVVLGAGKGTVAPERLRDIIALCNCPPIRSSVIEFAIWTANYVMAPLPRIMKMVMCVPEAFETPLQELRYRIPQGKLKPKIKTTPQRDKLLYVLSEAGQAGLDAPTLLAHAGCGRIVLTGLLKLKAVEKFTVEPSSKKPPLNFKALLNSELPQLSHEQALATTNLLSALWPQGGTQDAAGQKTVVLEGVTGSGKTEVYMEAIQEALSQGKQALILLPEIALTPQMLARFKVRFGFEPAPWHSQLTQRRRREIWRGIAQGHETIVIGARSALFLPFLNLGLIVVDEEHDPAYKQEDGVRYNARDLAVVRGKLEGCSVILASATPSLETVINVRSGKYAHSVLTTRFRATMPTVEHIDLRADPPDSGHFLSPQLVAAVLETLASGEQALLFLNRRGFAPLTLCNACGYRYSCKNCSAWLVAHQRTGHLHCHHCGGVSRAPTCCIECGGEDSLVACGPGVERIAAEAKDKFPKARIALASSDTLSTPKQALEFAQAMQAKEIDLLIGTQIIAKGHHFPELTCVGVVDGDLGLGGADPKASERTRSLLHQVSGRAGRAERPGRVMIQTRNPDHPVMQALVSEDQEAWISGEIDVRKQAGLPPFRRMAALILSSANFEKGAEAGRLLRRAAPQADGVYVLGPAPAVLPFLRGRYRWRLLMFTERTLHPQPILQAWLEAVEIPTSVRLQIDIDPVSLL